LFSAKRQHLGPPVPDSVPRAKLDNKNSIRKRINTMNKRPHPVNALWRFLSLSSCIVLFLTLPNIAEATMNTPNETALTLDQSQTTALDNLIPKPVSVQSTGDTFTLSADTKIHFSPDDVEIRNIGQYLADKLKPATGYNLPVLVATSQFTPGNIYLTTQGGEPALGEEGYELSVSASLVKLTAHKPAGLFRGIQTIRQLLPPAIESGTAQAGPWTMPTGTVKDQPRFGWRGAMLDVARHFFKVEDVKRFIDLLAYYKMNRFHLHLSDDQGWRIVIDSWPNLATHGGSTQVGGGPGGYYTKRDYADIVTYAQSRYIVVVPEIDMPGHTNAALASYAKLNCNGVAPELYTGTKVGFSTLCTSEEITYDFVDDVVREIAALTPGPYFHIGGDESQATQPDDYVKFVELVQGIVKAHGKQPIGWEEIAQAKLIPTTIVQHWHSDHAQKAVQQGAKVIMSPASKTYLDMKYDRTTPLGLDWAGLIEVQTGYAWDPAKQVNGITEKDILGVEAPLWSETIQTIADIEFMTFPRLLGYAEIGWSAAEGRGWDEYKTRLGIHSLRLTAMGVKFYRSSQVPWQ
jgi:hexosaminidase